MDALTDFGFGDAGIPIEYFQKEGTAIHLGVDPNRIDFLTCLKGVSNEILFDHIMKIEYDGKALNIISKEDLILTKKAS